MLKEQKEKGGEKQEEFDNSPDYAVYKSLFLGRENVFGRFWQRTDGRMGYTPVYHIMSDEALASHLQGETILATYLLQPDETIRALVIDIDGPEATPNGEEKAFVLAIRLISSLAKQSLEPLWFSSGGKGYHLWFCFTEAVQAKVARQWVQKWLEKFRPFPEGVLVEIFPKQDSLAPGALGSLIRLPLGRHPKTGRWSKMLDLSGKSVINPWFFLKSAPTIDFSLLYQLTNEDGSSLQTSEMLPAPPEAITQIIEGCSLMQAIIEKAARMRHLRHTERLALLYTLGACSEAGQVYLHQVIGCCANYNPRITERWLRRLEEGHKPIRCSTLQEWLKDHLPGVVCSCKFKGQLRSPIELQGKKAEKTTKYREQKKKVAQFNLPEEDWERVAQDLFPGEANAEEDLNQEGESE